MTPSQSVASVTCICGNAECEIPYGSCHCGCGRKTNLATQNSRKYGWIKGEPVKYSRGHQGTLPRVDTSQIQGFKIDGVYCRLISLTRGMYAIVWASDYEWLSQWTWFADRRADGKRHYAVRVEKNEKGKTIRIKMHRVILGLAPDDRRIGDHIRPDETLNNTRGNLRIANHSESQCNRLKPKHNTSGFKGVRWIERKQKYQADLWVGGKHYNLGCSDTPEGASLKYEAGLLKYHGLFGQKR